MVLLTVRLEGGDSGARAGMTLPVIYLVWVLKLTLTVICDTDLEGKYILVINL